ncbi:MAG TPA: aminotransferase class III-fold pyridoxal phosphate-dependent enzyme [Pirellulales bacterium]|nr:aminotransferase class III-fold pyridoxal phosphate-dependent enzyme [Pirellulales bacterium]
MKASPDARQAESLTYMPRTAEELSRSYAAKRPKGRKFHERAGRVLAGGVGHDLRHFEPVPLYIARGSGGRKWDVDGHEYVDFLLGNAALLLGHADREVIDAVARAMADGSHFGNDHPLHIEWAEWVGRLVPAAERVRFVNSGSEATLLALRLARAFTGKTKILRFEGHFHGWHDDVVHGFQPPFDADGSLGVPGSVRANQVTIPDNDLERLDEALSSDGDIAAAILEPSGASWGRVPLAEGFLQCLRTLTARHDVLLIFDEVVSGFRFSPGGAQQLYGVTPDLACLAKVLAGGMPGGAVVGRADIMRLFDHTGDARHDRHGRVLHLGTFNASPPSAAAGIVALGRIAGGEPIERANRLATFLRAAFNDVLERLGVAGYAYGPASTFHVYFETDRDRVRRAGSRTGLQTTEARRLKGMPGELITQYQRRLRHHGVDLMSSTGGVLSSAHTEADLAHAAEAFEATVKALREERLVLDL